MPFGFLNPGQLEGVVGDLKEQVARMTEERRLREAPRRKRFLRNLKVIERAREEFWLYQDGRMLTLLELQVCAVAKGFRPSSKKKKS
ncbi:MAG TPA: hypothetical protein VJG67_01040 [Candidatus Paceibacterota bacterium]